MRISIPNQYPAAYPETVAAGRASPFPRQVFLLLITKSNHTIFPPNPPRQDKKTRAAPGLWVTGRKNMFD